MPLLRTRPALTRDKGRKTIIVCLPAIEACVGLPFASTQAMSAAATQRGIEILRREINLSALTDKSESMKNIKVVIADVGALDVGTITDPLQEGNTFKEDWSPPAQLIYGSRFTWVSQPTHLPTSRWAAVSAFFRNDPRRGLMRKPTDVNVFVDNIVSVVGGGRHTSSLFGLGLNMGQIRNWIRGDRFSVGAGGEHDIFKQSIAALICLFSVPAKTYRIASRLPSVVLETLLNIPYFLISLRNRLLPTQPFINPEPTSIPTRVVPKSDANNSPEPGQTESGRDISETSSEVDVESNLSETGGSTWIRLKTQDPQR